MRSRAPQLSADVGRTGTVSARVFVLLARNANVGVVFRRGPSKQVLLLRWDLESDSFEAGQWLKARIYERRCDLSPNGERLVYFAASYRGPLPLQTWTAVSRPPYFTALALWPKGDAWGGGGLFSGESHLLLNHPASQMALADGFAVPRKVRIGTLPNAGRGEDSPIFEERSRRDGCEVLQRGTRLEQRKTARLWIKYDPPKIWSKPHPLRSVRCRLLRCTEGIKEVDGPWYLTSYRLDEGRDGDGRDIGRADWADWCPDGDLLFAKEGKLFRIAMTSRARFDVKAPARELVDLSPLTFVQRQAPVEAKAWIGRPPAGVSVGAAVQPGVAGGLGPRLRSDPRR